MPTPAARYLGPADRDLLAAMRCSTGVWFEDEVDEVVTSTYLECAAVSAELQGAVLAEVERLDDDGRPVTLGRYLLEVLLSDISECQHAPIVRVVVARENTRSQRLCTRIGLAEERDDPDERFVQRIGRMAT